MARKKGNGKRRPQPRVAEPRIRIGASGGGRRSQVRREAAEALAVGFNEMADAAGTTDERIRYQKARDRALEELKRRHQSAPWSTALAAILPPPFSGEARVIDGAIRFHVALAFLPRVIERGSSAMARDPEKAVAVADQVRVTDVNAAAASLVARLNEEDEDGRTPVHRMFDDIIDLAIEDGDEGIEG